MCVFMQSDLYVPLKFNNTIIKNGAEASSYASNIYESD